MEAAHTLWRPLGTLLVAQGLVTEDQLEHALREQAATGRRLGEILVDLQYLSRRALSLALAHQYGIDLPTETGFGTGLLAAIQLSREREDGGKAAPEAPPQLSLVPPLPDAGGESEEPIDLLPLAGLEEQWARLASAEERLAGTERELTALIRTNERRRRQVVRLLARLRERDRRPRGASPEAPQAEPAPPEAHLLLVQLAHGYELVERSGPPPEPDARLDLPDLGPLVVLRVGRSPLPGDARRCALAHAAHAGG